MPCDPDCLIRLPLFGCLSRRTPPPPPFPYRLPPPGQSSFATLQGLFAKACRMKTGLGVWRAARAVLTLGVGIHCFQEARRSTTAQAGGGGGVLNLLPVCLKPLLCTEPWLFGGWVQTCCQHLSGSHKIAKHGNSSASSGNRIAVCCHRIA